MNKRLISFILSICMLLSLLPAGTLFAGAEDESYIYELSYAKHYSINPAAYDATADKAKIKSLTFENDTIAAYKADSNVYNALIRKTPRFDIYLQTTPSESVGSWIALDIELEKDGLYTSKYEPYNQGGAGMVGDVYLLPYSTNLSDITSAISTGTKIASGVDYSVKSSAQTKTQLYLEKGKHTLLIYCTGSGSKTDGTKTRFYMSFKQFSLEWNGMPSTKNSLVPEKARITAGETTALTVTDSNGKELSVSEIKEMSSSDEEIATVDAASMTVTAGNKTGNAKISAKLVVDGNECEAVGSVRVINEKNSGASVKATLDERLSTWVNPGYYRDPNPYYDTATTDKNRLANAKNDIAGFETGDGITAEYTDGWSWYGDSVKKHDCKAFLQGNGDYLRFDMGLDDWCAFKINVPAAGRYRTVLNHSAAAPCANGAVYLIPVPGDGEKVEDYLTDAYKVGGFENYDPDIASAVNEGAYRTDVLDYAYADYAGEHLIVFVKTEAPGPKSRYIYVNDISFSGASPVISIVTESDRAINIGDTFTLDKSIISWEAELSDYTENSVMSFESLTEDVLTVSEDGTVTAVGNGTGRIKVTVTYAGTEFSDIYQVIVGSGKTRRSFYSEEMINNAVSNFKRFDWAKKERDDVVEEADKLLLNGIDTLYNLITSQELPRSNTVAFRKNDTGQYTCVYCDAQLNKLGHGTTQPFIMDIFARPWKIQCPECKRLFPSNDFGSFYELGISSNGNWSYMQALQKHHEKFVCASGSSCECIAPQEGRGSDEWNRYYGYGKGYLKNEYYSEVGTSLGVAPEEVDRWAVDDGWGYEYEYTLATGTVEKRCEPFIAFYNYRLWQKYIKDAIENLSFAYLYTGEEKYGRAGAVMLDRIADVFPEFDTTECGAQTKFAVGDGNSSYLVPNSQTGKNDTVYKSQGKILGRLHDATLAQSIVVTYDALFPIFEDEWVIDYLEEKARLYDMENKKDSAAKIRSNIENNYFREIFDAICEWRISANFGVTEKLLVEMAIVLDTLPETEDWINFMFKTGGHKSTQGRVDNYGFAYDGGNAGIQIMNKVDRDGQGYEAALAYNISMATNVSSICESLGNYYRVSELELADDSNILENPKFRRIMAAPLDIILCSNTAPNVGDHETYGKAYTGLTLPLLLRMYTFFEDEPERREIVAKLIYQTNGKKTDGLYTSIFDAEPEEIVSDIDELSKNGFDIVLPSRDLTGYGLAVLRGGDWINSADKVTNVNNQYDYYLWYGDNKTSSHYHFDKLSLGFHAYGLPVGDDIGEPVNKTNGDPYRFEVAKHTVSHNTVMVNDASQGAWQYGNPRHFDSAEMVQLTDVEAPEVYSAQGVEEYRRTLVSVKVDESIAYAVDFFHVKGGNDHLYSFHALGREAELSDNLEFVKQADSETGEYIGSYQGVDKLWGGSNQNGDADGHGTYSWFGEVDRVNSPENADVFSMDWKIDDHWKVLTPQQKNLHVRLTMINSSPLSEITATSLIPPQVKGAMDKTRYLFARRTSQDGAALDTLFTAVVEPYKNERYIADIEQVTVERADGTPVSNDEVKAVKVTLAESGREDYIVYAKDNSVEYKVYYSTEDGDKNFVFCGFVGVVSVNRGEIIYTYINDGTAIADKKELVSEYAGSVSGFQTDNSTDNFVDVEFISRPEEISSLVGRYIYINNNSDANGAYRIESVSEIDNGIRLNIGDTTLITGYKDVYDFKKGYDYNVSATNEFIIPMSYEMDNSPEFTPLSDNITTSAGSSISVPLNATSEVGEAIAYKAVQLPRGASLDTETGEIKWKPDSSQVGNNVVIVKAIDEMGREDSISFNITVYGATTGKPSDTTTETPTAGNEGTAGGGGGGGVAPTDKPEASDDQTELPPDKNTDEEKNTAPDASGETDIIRFTDLSNHAWAADAINSLADDGVIKGTSATTFSPAANITRADFAVLLVRAFRLSSDDTENFDDVMVNDYYASELAIARNTGIVNGIGDNCYAPRNTITRQDMMVIVYRALQSLGNEPPLPKGRGTVEDGGGISPSQYPDFTNVAPYARDAVSALISTGLVNGKSGCIAPNDYTTRAEVAVLIKRIIDYTK